MTEEQQIATVVVEQPPQTQEPPIVEKETPVVPLFQSLGLEEEEKKEEQPPQPEPPKKVIEKTTEYVGLAGYKDANEDVRRLLKYSEATAGNLQEYIQKITEFSQMQPISLESINVDDSDRVRQLIKSDLKAKYGDLSDEDLELEVDERLANYELGTKVSKLEYLRGVIQSENERRKTALGDIDSNIFELIDTKTETQTTDIQPELTEEVFREIAGEKIAVEPITISGGGMELLKLGGGTQIIQDKANEYYEILVQQNLIVEGGKIVLPESFDKAKMQEQAMKIAGGEFLWENREALFNAAVETALKIKQNAILKQANIGKTIVQKEAPKVIDDPDFPTMEQWSNRQ